MVVGLQISKDPDGAIRSNAVNQLASGGLSLLEMWLNPIYLDGINDHTKNNKAYYLELYKILDRTGSFPSYFASLWYSTLPCYDLKGITAIKDGDGSLLKKCLWKGVAIPCAAIFQKFPTDRGMCCTFNRAAAEDIFVESTYTKIMNNLKTSDSREAFQNATLPQWYVDAEEPNTRTGINSGLTVYLDAHTDKIESMSISSDIQGFSALIAPRTDFPLTFQKGFEVRPGHKNLIALSATKIDSDDGIRHIKPINRNCKFPEESEELTLHKNYSQASCILECSLSYAQQRVKEARNTSYTCTPWFFPFSDEGHVMCDPWESAEVVSIMEHQIPTDQCSFCLPDCSRTIYQYTASFQPFRKCDEKNFGVSDLCNLEMTSSLPEPQIFGTQVLDQLNSTNGSDPGSIPAYAANVTSSRRYLLRTFVMDNVFDKLEREYDAYDSDIAMLNIYFDAVSVMQFGTQESQGWIDFFSNVGGLLGLCIGLSIITIIELIWLCCRLIGNHFRPLPPPDLSRPPSGYYN
jgi:amiloride-sensitive sodium channel